MTHVGPWTRPFRVKRSTSNWLPLCKVLGLHWLTRVLRRRHAATPIYQRSRRGNKTMTNHDSDFPAPTGAKRLRFDRYVLDLDRGSLLLEGSEIAVRSKIPAVLFRRKNSLPRYGRVWPSPTMRWCRASANCGGPLQTMARA
jgi:hypothetical protein